MSHFPKGGTTLTKAKTLVGDFLAHNVALYPHPPRVALTRNHAERASPLSPVRPAGEQVPAAAREGSPGAPILSVLCLVGLVKASATDKCVGSQLPETAARRDPGCRLGHPKANAHVFCGLKSAGVGRLWFPPRHRAQRAGREGRPVLDEGDPLIARWAHGPCTSGPGPAARAASLFCRACSSPWSPGAENQRGEQKGQAH